MENQYEKFRGRVRDTVSKKKIDLSKASSQKAQYYEFFKDPSMYEDCEDIMHLCVGSMVRTHCEAVVEGMGNILKNNMAGRLCLKHDTIEKELIIHWQGPHPGKQSNELFKRSFDGHFAGKDWHFV